LEVQREKRLNISLPWIVRRIPRQIGTELRFGFYYEDTDFAGAVYHASYLRFLERARPEWLRRLGFANRQLRNDAGITFAVRGLQIDYLAPALMDDLVTVETRVESFRGPSINFFQRIFRRQQVLVVAHVLVTSLREGRPVRLPESLS
jgi:acyl-CoA thioester hydrolase